MSYTSITYHRSFKDAVKGTSIIILVFILIVVTLKGALAESFCHQETANASNSCGGLATGNYFLPTGNWTNQANLLDGDWDTSATPISDGTVYWLVNYTIPVSADFSKSFVQTKKDLSSSYYLENTSLSPCTHSTILALRFTRTYAPTRQRAECQVLNHTYTTLYEHVGDGPEGKWYEDAAVWFLPDTKINVHTSVNGTLINPECEINDFIFYPQDNNISFDESEDNVLTCTYPGHKEASFILPRTTILNFTMNATNTTLWFSRSTDGLLFDETPQYFGFTSTQMLSVRNGRLAEGIVSIQFNNQSYFGNFTQYYEYENTGEDDTNESLVVLDEWSIFNQEIENDRIYFKVTDFGGSIIKNAKIRIYGNRTLFNLNYVIYANKLLGQRIVPDTGETFFYLPQTGIFMIVVTADGYAPEGIPRTRNDLNGYDQSTPYTIKLRETSDSYKGVFALLYRTTYSNTTAEIKGNVYAPGKDTVQYNTSYKPALTKIAGDDLERYYFVMNVGDEFSNTTAQDLIVYFYIDGEYWGSRTVTWKEEPVASIIELPALSWEYIRVLAVIGLLVIIILIQNIIPTPDIGFTTFMIGSMLLTILNAKFAILSSVCILYYAGRYLRGTATAD